MAGRILNRRALREQADLVGQPDAVASDPTATVVGPRKRKAKATATPKPRKPRKAKKVIRLRARWGVFDASMKQVAIFDYNQRAAAEERVNNLLGKNRLHFLQIVKDQMPEPDPVEAPAAV